MSTLRVLIVLSMLLTQTVDATDGNKTTIFCPKPSELVKKNGKWESTTRIRWLSYETSFANEVAFFMGAQWQGVKVGPMSCIYQSSDINVFPITLQNDHMFEMPTQANWSAGEENAVNCVSNTVEDCPLTPHIKTNTPDTTQQIFQSIDANTS